jgi:HEAT repeat protein
MKSPDAVEPLKDLLRGDVEPDVAGEVVLSLGRLGTEAAVEELLRLRKEGGELGKKAGMSVGLAKGRGVVQPILREIDTVTDENMKLQWVRALGQSGSSAPIDKLREMMGSGNETQGVRGGAMEALARLRDGESTAAIAEVLGEAPKDAMYLRRSALIALERLVRVDSTKDVMQERVVPVLEEIVAQNDGDYAYHRAHRLLAMLRGFR